MKAAEQIIRDHEIKENYFFSQDDVCEISQICKIYARKVVESMIKQQAEKYKGVILQLKGGGLVDVEKEILSIKIETP